MHGERQIFPKETKGGRGDGLTQLVHPKKRSSEKVRVRKDLRITAQTGTRPRNPRPKSQGPPSKDKTSKKKKENTGARSEGGDLTKEKRRPSSKKPQTIPRKSEVKPKRERWNTFATTQGKAMEQRQGARRFRMTERRPLKSRESLPV